MLFIEQELYHSSEELSCDQIKLFSGRCLTIFLENFIDRSIVYQNNYGWIIQKNIRVRVYLLLLSALAAEFQTISTDYYNDISLNNMAGASLVGELVFLNREKMRNYVKLWIDLLECSAEVNSL